jgi:hypothetical protein
VGGRWKARTTFVAASRRKVRPASYETCRHLWSYASPSGVEWTPRDRPSSPITWANAAVRAADEDRLSAPPAPFNDVQSIRPFRDYTARSPSGPSRYQRPQRGCYGLPAIGRGTTVYMCGRPVIGALTSASTVESIAASATQAPDIKAAIRSRRVRLKACAARNIGDVNITSVYASPASLLLPVIKPNVLVKTES